MDKYQEFLSTAKIVAKHDAAECLRIESGSRASNCEGLNALRGAVRVRTLVIFMQNLANALVPSAHIC